MEDKLQKYCALVERVKGSYPSFDPEDDMQKLRLYW